MSELLFILVLLVALWQQRNIGLMLGFLRHAQQQGDITAPAQLPGETAGEKGCRRAVALPTNRKRRSRKQR